MEISVRDSWWFSTGALLLLIYNNVMHNYTLKIRAPELYMLLQEHKNHFSTFNGYAENNLVFNKVRMQKIKITQNFTFSTGGAGEGKQHLKPEGDQDNKQEVKTDEALPFYCHPPNPCPKGFSRKLG